MSSQAADHHTPQLSRRNVLRAGLVGGAALVGSGLLDACGSSSSSSSSNKKGPAQLRLWTWYSEDNHAFPRMISEFEATHPNIKISNRIITFDNYNPALEASVSAGDVPDIFAPGVLALTYGKNGIAADLKKVLGSDFMSDFFPSTNTMFQSGGAQYAIGWEAQTFGLYYNPDVLKKAKVDLPETWDDLMATVEPFKKIGVQCCSFNGTPSASVADFFLPLITQATNNPKLVLELDQQTNGATWNSKPVIEALAKTKQIFDAGVFNQGALGTSSATEEELFYTKKVAMNWEGSWMPADLVTSAPKKFLTSYKVMPNPAWSPGARHWTPNQAGSALSLSAHSPHLDAAAEFLQFLYEPARYVKIMNETNSMPSTVSAAAKVENPIVKIMTGYLTAGDGCPHILFGPGSEDAAGTGAEAVITGKSTPAAAAAQIQATVERARHTTS